MHVKNIRVCSQVALSLLAVALACGQGEVPAAPASGSSGSSGPPPSPCPQVFSYEAYPASFLARRWRGVVRLQSPPRFSSLELSLMFAASEHLPEQTAGAEVLSGPGGGAAAGAGGAAGGGPWGGSGGGAGGSLSLRGGVQAARALVRAALERRRKTLEFVADFPCGLTSVPSLLNITVNGRVFCSAPADPVHMRSTISLMAALDTGLEASPEGEGEFAIPPEDSRAAYRSRYDSEPPPPSCESPAAPGAPQAEYSVISPSSQSDLYHVSTETPEVFLVEQMPYQPPTALLPNQVTEMQSLPPLPVYRHPQRPPRPPPRRPTDSVPDPTPDLPTPLPTSSHGPRAPNLIPSNQQPPLKSAVDEEAVEQCGRAWSSAPNLLVTKGAAAPRGRWPWLAALFKKVGGRNQLGLNFECGATLISRRHVITAAHCVESRARRRKPVDAAMLVVYLGKHDLLSYTEPGQHTAEVDSVRIHPQYGQEPSSSSSSSSAYGADLALLVLSDEVKMTRHIRPVCLWDATTQGTDLTAVVGKIGMVPGWGKDDTGALSNEVKVASMPIVSQETCLRSNVFYTAFTSDSTFCAGFKNGTSVCNGDSGGGLYVAAPDGRWLLRGVVSVSMFKVNEQSCDAYNYVVFTDVAKFLTWIYEQVDSSSS